MGGRNPKLKLNPYDILCDINVEFTWLSDKTLRKIALVCAQLRAELGEHYVTQSLEVEATVSNIPRKVDEELREAEEATRARVAQLYTLLDKLNKI